MKSLLTCLGAGILCSGLFFIAAVQPKADSQTRAARQPKESTLHPVQVAYFITLGEDRITACTMPDGSILVSVNDDSTLSGTEAREFLEEAGIKQFVVSSAGIIMKFDNAGETVATTEIFLWANLSGEQREDILASISLGDAEPAAGNPAIQLPAANALGSSSTDMEHAAEIQAETSAGGSPVSK